jgi:exopolysaccharide biosynthesis polyprenyl glycosylphosphotransferase
VLDQDAAMVGQKVGNHQVVGTFNDLAVILERQVVDQVVIIVPRSTLNSIEPILHHCETIGTTVSVAIDLFNTKFTIGREENVLGLPLITFQTVTDKVGQLLFKKILDITVAGTLIILASPLYVIIAVLIKLTSKGPVYFTQERCGLQGRKFKLYKFRTMVLDAESHLESLMDRNEMSGPVFKIKEDPRVTPFGQFLRKWSLDELPQLWNILHGDMSLVGPRPPIPREVEQYDDWQRRRLSMRPGLTGLWQVSGRNNISNFDDWVKLDLQYMDNWSLKEDFKIILRTVPTVLKGTGAR